MRHKQFELGDNPATLLAELFTKLKRNSLVTNPVAINIRFRNYVLRNPKVLQQERLSFSVGTSPHFLK